MTGRGREILQRDIEQIDRRFGKKRGVFAAYGLAEHAPFPAPMTFSLINRMTARWGGYGRAFRELGFRYDGSLGKDGFYTVTGGRLYVDLQREAKTYYGSMPLEHNYDELLAGPSSAFHHRPSTREKRGLKRFFMLPVYTYRLLRSEARMRRAQIERLLTMRVDVENMEEEIAQEEKADAAGYDDAKLAEWISELAEVVTSPTAKWYFLAATLASVSLMSLERTMSALNGAEGLGIARVMTSSLAGCPETEFALALADAAEGKTSTGEIVKRFGHRAEWDLELSCPRLRENEALLKSLVDRVRRAGPGKLRTVVMRNREASSKASLHLKKGLLEKEGKKGVDKFIADLDSARQFSVHAARTFDLLVRRLDVLRNALAELGRRRGLGDKIFFLSIDEALSWKDGNVDVASRRFEERGALMEIKMPSVIFTGEMDGLGSGVKSGYSGRHEGTGLSGGKGRGPVEIIDRTGNAPESVAGKIIVSDRIGFMHAPLVAEAAGVVVESAGVSGTAAGLARTFGVPAVASVADASERFTPGRIIEIDGLAGVIKDEGVKE